MAIGKVEEIYDAFGMDNEDLDDTGSFAMASLLARSDDGLDIQRLSEQLSKMLDTVLRIGGEVCRLRAEMDGLQEQNAEMSQRFEKLRAVIEEKGTLDMDDFQLACDVMQNRLAGVNKDGLFADPVTLKKLSH